MDNLHSPQPDDSSRNQNGSSKDNQKSSDNDRTEAAPPPHPMEQKVFDRLNAALEAGEAQEANRLQKEALDRLGKLMQQWRLKQGYTRGALAGKLEMQVTSLFCIENGIAKVDDLSAEQLLALKALIADDEAATLGAAIDEYRAMLKL